jgi:N-6 DNA Methylase
MSGDDVSAWWHRRWLGLVAPVQGLVVSVPVLVDAGCMQRLGPELSRRLADDDEGLTTPLGKGPDGRDRRAILDVPRFFAEVLELGSDLFDSGETLPAALSLHVPEGEETLRPTMALKRRGPASPATSGGVLDDRTPATRAGEAYVMLVVDADGLDLDAPDGRPGQWAYPPKAKFERLLRACHVPIGLLTNREEIRLVYAPHGESSGAITFRVADLCAVGGREILDAFVMLLSRQRFFGVASEHQLPSLLAESRKRQADVTTKLADQVLEALQILLSGFAGAAERDGAGLLQGPLDARGGEYVYGGLLTVLLRLVFLLYAEDRDLLPIQEAPYGEHLSVLALFGELQSDFGAHPDTMPRRFGAWPRLLAVFRAVYEGASWKVEDDVVQDGARTHLERTVVMPARRGELFDPTRYPFLEGWGPDGGAPTSARDRAELRVPTVDDETVFRVLERLLVLDGQRLSYRALETEQLGSVYEGLIGYRVVRLEAPAVCVRPERVWVTVADVRSEGPSRRAAWLQEATELPKAQAAKIAAEVNAARGDEAVLVALDAAKAPRTERARAGEYVLQPGTERRRTSAHYTPQSLTGPIVRRTLEPLLRAMGAEPSSKALLELKICDPAMGSGAFLVEACRFLGDQVVAAWTREGEVARIGSTTEDVVMHARRLVAQRCLYGVDLNQFAVTLARLSMWLVTLAKSAPFTFVDHALRHGDSLVGLNLDQLRAFHWKPGDQKRLPLVDSVAEEVDAALEEARGYRQRILDLAEAGPEATREKEKLLRDAELGLEKAQLFGDLVIGAFFAHDKDQEREKERSRRLDTVRQFLGGGEKDEVLRGQLDAWQNDVRSRDPHLRRAQPFHWMIEFPEVFYPTRRDPLVRVPQAVGALMDAFVGNTPFAGKNTVAEHHGKRYIPWLQEVHEGAHGNADYCAHFFRRTYDLLGVNGTFGFIATNTIAQGDTRLSSLHYLVNSALERAEIYDATRTMKWPGDVGVDVSVVHVAKGTTQLGLARLDGEVVEAINCRLRGKPERPDPVLLEANAEKSFQGSIVLGMGFTLSPDQREALVKKRLSNAQVIFPYIGGEEVNTSPTHAFDRYVIHFGQMTLEEAERWPDLIKIVREQVKPERDELADNADGRRRRTYWWQFGRDTPSLAAAIAPLKRCLVTGIVSKHLMFSFQPTDRIFSHKLYVFPFDGFTSFSVLQSRIHEPWAWLLCSTMRNAGINYSASDCFDTFGFPAPDPCTLLRKLEAIGETVYKARDRFMVETDQGLTKTYNALKDRSCDDPRVLKLRQLHEEMDRAVLAAYGWSDLFAPPYCALSDADRAATHAFEDEVIDRLFALNAERAEEERRAGLAAKPGHADSKSALARAVPPPAASEVRIGRKRSPIHSEPPPAKPGLARGTSAAKTASRARKRAS